MKFLFCNLQEKLLTYHKVKNFIDDKKSSSVIFIDAATICHCFLVATSGKDINLVGGNFCAVEIDRIDYIQKEDQDVFAQQRKLFYLPMKASTLYTGFVHAY